MGAAAASSGACRGAPWRVHAGGATRGDGEHMQTATDSCVAWSCYPRVPHLWRASLCVIVFAALVPVQWFLDEVRSLNWFGAEAAAGRDDDAAAGQQAGQPAAELQPQQPQREGQHVGAAV